MIRREIKIYTLLIILMNLPLLWGKVFKEMIFIPEEVTNGQFWRIATHSFVHVTWYHLLLDSAAFFLLYFQLEEKSLLKRTIYVATCTLSSLLAVILVLPKIAVTGYCGLSGTAHGLMAICSLEMILAKDKSVSLTGMICIGLLITKCIFESITGTMLFNFIHHDLIGVPIAMAHVGGLIGGILTYIAFSTRNLNIDILKNKIATSN